jgi:hypothetical protein
MSSYRIVFRVEDASGTAILNERAVAFQPGESPYDRLTDAMLVMAKIIKSVLNAPASRADS